MNNQQSDLEQLQQTGIDKHIGAKERRERNVDQSIDQSIDQTTTSANDVKKAITITKNSDPSKPKKNKKRNRCHFESCKKRLMLTDITCRCGSTFCSLHVGGSSHKCTFDYKKQSYDILQSKNQPSRFSKLDKI